MPVDPGSTLVITAYGKVPSFVRGLVRDLRVRWACEEAGLAYAEDLIDVFDKPGDFAAKQPWTQVPALRDGDVRLFESGAILIHLAEQSAMLMPREPQARADVLSWTFAAFNSVEPLVMELTNAAFFTRDEGWTKLRMPSLMQALAKRLRPVAARLEGRDWLADTFSIADIAMAHILMAASKGSDLISQDEVLSAYLGRATARPAYKQALADQLAAHDRSN